MEIVWAEPARHDLCEILEYVAVDNANAALKLLTEINKRVLLLSDNPSIGRLGRVENTKELMLPGTHYILPYRVVNNQIQVLAVFHTSRQ